MEWGIVGIINRLFIYLIYYLSVVFFFGLQLDQKYLNQSRTSGKAGMIIGSSYLAVPDGMDVYDNDRSNLMQLHHVKIPEENKVLSAQWFSFQ